MSQSQRRRNAIQLRNTLLTTKDPVIVISAVSKYGLSNADQLLDVLDELGPESSLPADVTRETAERLFDIIATGLARLGCDVVWTRLANITPKDIRWSVAACAAAHLGTVACIDTCRQALVDDKYEVRSALLNGLRMGRQYGDRSPEFVNAMFDEVAAMMVSGNRLALASSAKALVAVDAVRAADVFLDPKVLSAGNWRSRYALDALLAMQTRVPKARLSELSKEFLPTSDSEEAWDSYVRVGRLMLAVDPTEGRRLLEDGLTSSSESVRQFAIDALLEEQCLVPIFQDHDTRTYKRWPWQQRVRADIAEAMLETESSGLSGIFVNHHPLWWRTVAEALITISASRSQAVITEMATLAGLADPGLSDADVREWIWPDEAEKLEATLFEIWSQNEDRREVLLYRFMLEHRRAFRRRGTRNL